MNPRKHSIYSGSSCLLEQQPFKGVTWNKWKLILKMLASLTSGLQPGYPPFKHLWQRVCWSNGLLTVHSEAMCTTPACLFPAGSEPWSLVRGTFHYSETLPECSGWHSSQGQSQPSVATPAASQHPPGSTPGSLLSCSLLSFWCLSAFWDFCLLPLGLFPLVWQSAC